MTVPYNSYIHTVTFAGFFNLLLKWNGSVYKLLWRTMVLYVLVYSLIAVIYHFCLTKDMRILFEMMFDYFNVFQENIPVSFVLGFYVSCIVGRWWEQFNALPHPTRLAIFVTSHIRGTDDRTRLVRRTIMRYACLGYVLTMVTVCGPAKKRFPTYKHMIKAGFLLTSEKKILDNLITNFNKYYVPFIWASTLVAQARKENMIKDDFAYHCVLDELNQLRRKCQTILNYDWINIPLVYTQVATMAVYVFFVSCLISRQHIPVYTETGKPTNQGEMIVPLFTFLQFLFYMGWLKVAEELINPFGEDDDDFEINPMIDKNFKLSYLIVDEMHGACPSLVKDQYWDTTDVQMPYTEAALPFYKDPGLLGSAKLIDVPQEQQQIVNLPPLITREEKKSSQGDMLKKYLRRSSSSSSKLAAPPSNKKESIASFIQLADDLKEGGKKSQKFLPNFDPIVEEQQQHRHLPMQSLRISKKDLHNAENIRTQSLRATSSWGFKLFKKPSHEGMTNAQKQEVQADPKIKTTPVLDANSSIADNNKEISHDLSAFDQIVEQLNKDALQALQQQQQATESLDEAASPTTARADEVATISSHDVSSRNRKKETKYFDSEQNLDFFEDNYKDKKN